MPTRPPQVIRTQQACTQRAVTVWHINVQIELHDMTHTMATSELANASGYKSEARP